MAGSKFAYVKRFELPDPLLPGTFIVLRLDGHSFHRFSDKHNFVKPNDSRALQLMDHAARDVMDEYPDIVFGFGESDEFSFLFRKSADLYHRRQAKIISTLTSLFTSSYVFHWSIYFPNVPLQYPPSFDGRIVLYPSEREVRDYFSWRQADSLSLIGRVLTVSLADTWVTAHINNLYNTTFWALVMREGQTTTQAHATLQGTVSKEKHEILFSRFQINYNSIEERFRKGSVLFRKTIKDLPDSKGDAPTTNTEAPHHDVRTSENIRWSNGRKLEDGGGPKTKITVVHCDIIKDDFWEARSGILAS